MTVSELIEELQNFPMDLPVWINRESSEWCFNGEYSQEFTNVELGECQLVERGELFGKRYVKVY